MPPEDILRSQTKDKLSLMHEEHLIVSARVLIAGLGGSELAGAFLRDELTDTRIELHRGFDVPKHVAFLGSSLVASSTSGDTVETISAFIASAAAGMSRSIITRGGKLLDMAKQEQVPYVVMPSSALPPREVLVHSLLSHCLVLGQERVYHQICDAIESVSIAEVHNMVEQVLPQVQGKSVLLYAADEQESLLRYIKVNLNETARIPAYIGLVPEVLHGEIAVLDGGLHGPALSEQVAVLQLQTADTDPRIVERMRALSEVVTPKKVSIITLELPGRSWSSVSFGATFALVLSHRLREYGGVSRDGENLIGTFKRIMLHKHT